MASGSGDLSTILGDAINQALKDHEGRHHTRRSAAPEAPSLTSMPHLRKLLASTGAESAAAHELSHFVHEVIQAELRRTRA
jgi:hypothetical protein